MFYLDLVDDRWIPFGDFNGYGSEIENIVISDMDLDGKSEILVLWNTLGASSGNILSVYCSDSVSKKLKEISNESCLLAEVIDIEDPDKEQI